MANVHYVNCEVCGKEYYVDKELYQTVLSNPEQVLKCPFCKKEFILKKQVKISKVGGSDLSINKTNWKDIKKVTKRAGVTRQVFSGQNSMMVLNEIHPSAAPALHHHSHEQLTYIIQGNAEFVLGDKVLDLIEGDTIVIPPHIPHSLKAVGEETVLNLDVFSPIREDYLS